MVCAHSFVCLCRKIFIHTFCEFRVNNHSIICQTVWWKLIWFPKKKETCIAEKKRTANWSLILLYEENDRALAKIWFEEFRSRERTNDRARTQYISKHIRLISNQRLNVKLKKKHENMHFFPLITMLRKNITPKICKYRQSVHRNRPMQTGARKPKAHKKKSEYSQFYANIFAFFSLFVQ